jgi:hypothetical protein
VIAQEHSRASDAKTADHRTELLRRLSDSQNCGQDCRWEIADRLGKPANTMFLLTSFQRAKSSEEKLGIIYALYRIDDQELRLFSSSSKLQDSTTARVFIIP